MGSPIELGLAAIETRGDNMRRNNLTIGQAIKWWGWYWCFLIPLNVFGSIPMATVTQSSAVGVALFAAFMLFCASLPMLE